MNIWNWFLKAIRPLVIWWGGLHFPWTHKKITGDQYYLWRDLISPGCVLLTRTKGEFSNFINPSPVPHGALYTGGDRIKYVIEALGKGVVYNNLVTFMTTKDVFIIVRPKFGNSDQLAGVCQAAEVYQGKPYDYLFEKGDEAFYCFELVIKAFNDIFPNKIFKCKEIVKGKRIYDADTFLDDPENWEVVLDSREYFAIKDS